LENRPRRTPLAGHLVLHASGACGGAVAALAHVPLPWIVGSLLVSCVLALLRDAAPAPPVSRISGQLIIGAALGLAVTPEAVASVAFELHLAVISAIATVILGVVIGLLLIRFAGTDFPTAMFSSIPGGPAEMAQFARQYGGDPSNCALAQTLRIITIVVAFPALMAIGVSTDFALAPRAAAFDPLSFAALIGTAAAGALLAARLRIASPAFVGAMVMVGILVGGDFLHAAMPELVVIAGQVLIGVAIGSGLRLSLLKSAGRLVAQVTATTVALLAGCTAVASAIAWTTHLDLRTMALASAPGSMPEMAMTARALDLDFSLVTAFHLIRVLIVMISTPLVYRWAAARYGP
jgi:membrane AbrB-like protein